MDIERKTPYNSNYPKGGVLCSKDSFVVNGSLVFQIKFCGKTFVTVNTVFATAKGILAPTESEISIPRTSHHNLLTS